MENKKEQLETIGEIRVLMERSSKFVSLGGLSGIAAGAVAVIGSVVLSIYLKIGFLEQVRGIMIPGRNNHESGSSIFIVILALTVFIVASILAIYFSTRNAKKRKILFWDNMAKRVFINLFIFLLTGGMFCIVLYYYGIYFLIVASMLIFYGLALINVSKFTFNEIAQLGILEICLGFFSSIVTVYPLLMWVIGFGFLHLIYGTYVYLKYERVVN